MLLYLLLIAATAMAAGKAIIFKKIGVESTSKKQLFRLNGISFLVASLVAFASAGGSFERLFNISPFSLFMAFCFAASMVFTYITQIKALALGSASSTMMICSCGFLIPIFFGVLAYSESVSIVQIFAIVLLLAALFLIINPQKGSKASAAWILFSFFAMTGSGSTAIFQKIHQHSQFAGELSCLLTFAFLFGGVFLLASMFFIPEKEAPAKITRKEICVASLSGIFMSVLGILVLNLAGKLPAVILFPVFNVGSIILSGVVCALMFKETNDKKQIIGFIIGCIAIICIGIF